MVVAIIGFLGSASVIAYYYFSLQHSKNKYEELAGYKNDAIEMLVEQTQNENSESIVESENNTDNDVLQVEEKYVSPIDFSKLKKEENEDIYAWIQVDGTTVDYPVLQHKSDNSYYMLHNLDGSYGYPGCIYTENYNNVGFVDPLTVIYGHYMKDGTMFTSLHRFMDRDFFDAHDAIAIYLPDEEKTYTVLAAYYTNDKRITVWYDIYTYDGIQGWLDDVLAVKETDVNHIRDLDVSATEDNFIVLETCVDGDGTERYVVVAVENK